MRAGAKRGKRCPKREGEESELQFDISEAQDVFDRLSLKSVVLEEYLLVIRSRASASITLSENVYFLPFSKWYYLIV